MIERERQHEAYRMYVCTYIRRVDAAIGALNVVHSEKGLIYLFNEV